MRDGGGELAAEWTGDGPEFVVFEGVDGIAHATVVYGTGDGSHERRLRKAAGAAECGVRAGRCGERVAAEVADGAGWDWNLSPANIANGSRRDSRQEVAAESTAGGVEDATESIHGTSEDTHNRTPTGGPRCGQIERE